MEMQSSNLLSFEYSDQETRMDPFEDCQFGGCLDFNFRNNEEGSQQDSDVHGDLDQQVDSSRLFPDSVNQPVRLDQESGMFSNSQQENPQPSGTDSNQSKTKTHLKKRPPQKETEDSDEEDLSNDQSSSHKKRSFLHQTNQDPTYFKELVDEVLAQWSSTLGNSNKIVGRLRNHIQNIYTNHTFVQPQLETPVIRLILHQFYSTIIPNYDPNNPTASEERAAQCGLVLTEMKRSDQYVKKFWSKLKVIIYAKFKTESNKRADALCLITEKFDFKQEDAITFDNLFGKDVKHGLKKTTIEFILTHPKLFNYIFKNKIFEEACTQLNNGTLQDCETNILNKIEKFCEKKDNGYHLAPDLAFLEDQISTERKFKKPFSYMENNLAALQFLDKFIKRIKKVDSLSKDKKSEFDKKLGQLKKDLETTAKNNKWLPQFKHKKAEIISFLRVNSNN